MRFKKGEPRPARAGRKKGTPNKATVELREMIMNALNRAGGEDYLLKHSKLTAASFITLLGKILPSDINAKVTGTINWPLPKTKLDE